MKVHFFVENRLDGDGNPNPAGDARQTQPENAVQVTVPVLQQQEAGVRVKTLSQETLNNAFVNHVPTY